MAGQAVVSGLAASALYGTRWIDGEYRRLDGMPVTMPVGTTFDLARTGGIGMAVARLDALAAASDVKRIDEDTHRR